MFAHQVIEDLKKSKPADLIYDAYKNICINQIIKSNQFHLGDMWEFIDTMPNEKGKFLFMEHSEFLRLPYKICWFDYTCNLKRADPILDKGKTLIPKRGLLINEINTDRFILTIFNFVPNLSERVDVPSDVHWILSPYAYFIKIGNYLSSQDYLDWFKEKIKNDYIDFLIQHNMEYIKQIKFEKPGNIQPFLISESMIPIPTKEKFVIPKEIWTIVTEEDQGDLSCLNTAILLLNCRNIITEKNNPSLKLNKKRLKYNKQPLFSYYTLKLKLPSELKNHEISNSTERHNRLHFCRGHFKSYNKNKPLFGKITGLWWWQAYVRGKAKGTILKNYEIVKGE